MQQIFMSYMYMLSIKDSNSLEITIADNNTQKDVKDRQLFKSLISNERVGAQKLT